MLRSLFAESFPLVAYRPDSESLDDATQQPHLKRATRFCNSGTVNKTTTKYCCRFKYFQTHNVRLVTYVA